MKRKNIVLTVLLVLCVVVFAASLYFFTVNTNLLNDMQLVQASTQAFFENSRGAVLLEKSSPLPPAEIKTESDSNAFASYTKDGISFISYSEKWPEENLQLLYEELMNNSHGNEIDYLKEIIIYADAEKEYVSGLQESSQNTIDINILSTLVPKDFSISFVTIDTTIRLYNGDTRTTVSEMSRTLSHEYGHHFTNYYIFSNLDLDEWLLSDYAKLRGLSPANSFSKIEDFDRYMENHMWYIQEIAAEDYIQLFGSKTANQVITYYDVLDSLNGKDKSNELSENISGSNAIPQENMNLPLAADIPGLSEYFSSFINTPARTKTLDLSNIDIIFTKKSKGYRLTSGYETFVYYEVSWQAPYTDEDISYTLVCYDENEEILSAVKTLKGNQKQLAYIGNVSKESGNSVRYITDKTTSGIKYFRIIAVDGNQNIAVSKMQQFTF